MTTEQQLPEGWEYVPFNMFFNVVSISDKKISQKEYLNNGKYPVIDQGNLFIGGYSNDESLILKISSPVIVFGDHTKCFKYVSFPFVAGADGIKVLEPQNGIYPKYAYYYCLSIDLIDRGYSRHFAFLKKCQFLIVPIETQQAIVNKIESLFDEIDEGIGRLKTAAQQIQQYRQSLLKNAFNGELTKEWRSKHADTLPSENELLAQIRTAREQHHAQQLADWQTAVSQWEQNGKEGKKPSKPSSLSRVNILSKDSELPENWLLTEAESICDFITKGTTPPKNELFMKSGEVPFLKVYNLTKNGKLDFTIEPTFVSKETHNNFLNRSKVYPNDILMNIVGPPLGKVSLVPDDYPEWNINQAIVIYRSIFVHSKFLANYLLAEKTIKLMSSQAKTTAGQHNLTLEICRNLPIPVCSLAEQTQIVAILESKLTACDQLAAELAKQLKQAELLKQAVLKAAFSGGLLDK